MKIPCGDYLEHNTEIIRGNIAPSPSYANLVALIQRFNDELYQACKECDREKERLEKPDRSEYENDEDLAFARGGCRAYDEMLELYNNLFQDIIQ